MNEIEAMAAGALRFSQQKKGVVVNMGTGTTLVYAEEGKQPEHIFGSAVGGGTLLGLGSRLAGTSNYTELLFLAGKRRPPAGRSFHCRHGFCRCGKPG